MSTKTLVTVILCSYVVIAVVAHATDGNEGVEPTCENTKCPENSICKDEYGYVSCECIKGKTGVNCSLDDPCMLNTTDCPDNSICYGNCNPNIACEGATGHAHCRGCVAGWTGIQCLEDVDECADEINACLNDGVCKNTMGDFDCICQTGWTGKQCDCLKGSACDVEEVITTETPLVEPDSGCSRVDFSIKSLIVLLSLNLWKH